MSSLKVPLIETSSYEEPGVAELAQHGVRLRDAGFITDENFAESDELRETMQELTHILNWTRMERTALESEWHAIRRMGQLIHDEGQKYHGRSNSYIPVYNRSRESLVSSLSQGLFPSDEYFDVTDRGLGDPEQSKAVKTYMQWEFESVAQLRSKIKPFIRQLVDFGTSPIKYWYKKELKFTGKLRRAPDLANLYRPESSYSSSAAYEGLCVSTRNIFSTYVYPTTADSLDEVQIIFEDIPVPRSFIEEMGRKKRWVRVDEALNAATNSQFNFSTQDQLRDLGQMSDPENGPAASTKLGSRRVLTEVWLDLVLPARAYMEGEDKAEPVPCKIVLAGDTPVEVRRNQFWHQKKPYLFARLNVKPGFFYGDGFGRLQRGLQYLVNDFANQTNDVGIYGINPIVKMNPATVIGKLSPIRPGVVWQMSDLNGVAFDRPPVELMQYGLEMVNALVSQQQDFGGAPPITQGIGGSRAGKTATQSQILQRNAQQPLQDIIEDIETDVMVPLLKGAWSNAQQYRDEEIMIQVAGRPIKVDRATLSLDAEFRYLASNQAVNSQVRAQQVMQFLQVVMPLMPQLQMMGYQINLVPLIKRLYNDGFGFRGFDDFMQQLPQMPPGMPPGMGPPGMGPPPGMAPANDPGARPRSATEQANEPGIEAQPGEADEFMSVRNNADMLAAMLGGGGFPE